MASRSPNTPGEFGGQAQLRREDLANQPSNVHQQQHENNVLQETGTQMGNMVQGAADIGKGAALTAVNIVRGTATGAANLAQGAAEAVKNTLGTNDPTATSHPANPTTYNNLGSNPSNPNNPSRRS